MTQSAPSVVLYHQAALMVQDLIQSYRSGAYSTVDDMSSAIRNILNAYQTIAGSPLLTYDTVSETEPPSSSKMNRTWRTIQADVNVAKYQAEVLRAATIFYHNTNVTELTKSRNENARARNKIKTLQMYNDSVDPSIITYKQFFHDDSFIDYTKNNGVNRSSIMDNSLLCLGFESSLTDVSKNSSVFVLDSSNGFKGNNVEIKDPATASTNPVTKKPLYQFKSEFFRAADPSLVVDAQPNTWFEYEHAFVSEKDRLSAANYNFEYEAMKDDGTSYSINWADGPSDGVLKLDLEIDLKSVKDINYISLLPYGLADNKNYPIHIANIKTSEDGTEWTDVNPSDIWIGTDATLSAARTAANVAVGTGVWSFAERSARYVRVSIEQPHGVASNIGHLAYFKEGTDQRVEGPHPPLTNPTKYYDPTKMKGSGIVQEREYFSGKRWVIGLRDITVYQIHYVQKSVSVTNRIYAGKPIDRVMIDADIYIPKDFNNTDNWVKFYISPDDGANWYQISRVTDDYLGIPEVIAFNDPVPEAFRETGVQYIKTTNQVTNLRVKVELSRPPSLKTSTPFVRSFELKVRVNA